MFKYKMILYMFLTISIFSNTSEQLNWPTKNKESFLTVIKKINTDNYNIQDIVEGDFNNDSLVDYIVAFGEDEFLYEKVSFIKNTEKGYQYLKDVEPYCGMSCYIKYLKLDNSSNKYLNIGLTNGFSGSGFMLYKLTVDGPEMIDTGFPATGMGIRSLGDIDNDGKIERVNYNWAGHSQYRFLIYFSEWNGEEFGDLKFYKVSYEDNKFTYPEEPTYLVLNYIEANYYNLKNELEELSYNKVIPFDFNCTELDFMYGSVDIEIVSKHDSEMILLATCENDIHIEKKFFHLKKVKNKWKVYSIGKTLDSVKK